MRSAVCIEESNNLENRIDLPGLFLSPSAEPGVAGLIPDRFEGNDSSSGCLLPTFDVAVKAESIGKVVRSR